MKKSTHNKEKVFTHVSESFKYDMTIHEVRWRQAEYFESDPTQDRIDEIDRIINFLQLRKRFIEIEMQLLERGVVDLRLRQKYRGFMNSEKHDGALSYFTSCVRLQSIYYGTYMATANLHGKELRQKVSWVDLINVQDEDFWNETANQQT